MKINVTNGKQPINLLVEAGTYEKKYKTAEGNPVILTDAWSNYPLKSLGVNMNPIQDLHSYDHPWVGGGGDNLLNLDWATGNTTNGVTFTTQSNGKIKLTGTAVNTGWTYLSYNYNFPYNGIQSGDQILLYGDAQLFIRFYDSNDTIIDSKATTQATPSVTVTIPATAVRMVVYIYTGYPVATEGQTFNTEVGFYISKNLTFTSWTPYENICPISGWSSVDVYADPRYGHLINWNQIVRDPLLTMDWNVAGRYSNVVLADNIATLTPTSDGTARGGQFRIDGVLTGHKYLAIADVKSTATGNIAVGMNGGFGQLRSITPNTWTSIGAIWTPTQDYATAWASFYQDNSITTSDRIQYKTPQVFDLTQMFGEEKANEIYSMEQSEVGKGVEYFRSLFPKSYYAYESGIETTVGVVNGEKTEHITKDLGQTVYGCTLNVVSGELNVMYVLIDLGSLTWYTYNDKFDCVDLPFEPLRKAYGTPCPMVCSIYKTGTFGNSAPQGDKTIWLSDSESWVTLWVEDKDYTTPAEFKTAMDGVQLCYKLAEPQTIQLTPEEVKTLMKETILMTNADSLLVEYRTNER